MSRRTLRRVNLAGARRWAWGGLWLVACRPDSPATGVGAESSGGSDSTVTTDAGSEANIDDGGTTTADPNDDADSDSSTGVAAGCTITWADGTSSALESGEAIFGYRYGVSANCDAIAQQFQCAGEDIDPGAHGHHSCAEPQAWSSELPPSQVDPHVVFEAGSTVPTATGTFEWGTTYDFAAGETGVATAAVFTDEGSIVLELAPTEPGSFRYALDVHSTQLRALDLERTSHVSGSAQHFYPYDWQATHEQTPVEPDLLIPGVMVRNPADDWVVVAHHDTQLFRVDISADGEDKRARFFRQTESATGFDQALDTHAMEVEEVDRLVLTTADGLRTVQRQRLGTPLPIEGLIAQAPHRGWSSEDGYLSADDYGAMASAIAAGGLQHIMLRLDEPQAWVSDLFTAEGLTTHYYMFLGVARFRRLDGRYCYSIRLADGAECVDGSTGEKDWILRDAGGDIYTASINPSWAFVDLRVPEFRQALVDRAVRAAERGFGGIFFDGPQLWGGGSRDVFATGVDTVQRTTIAGDGRVGGVNSRGIAMSWYRARALLVQQTREAVREVAPGAYVGILGNEYVDFQAAADYVLKELVNWAALPLPDDPRCRAVDYAAIQTALEDEAFGNLYDYYAPQRVLGIKGNDAAQINSLHDMAAALGVGSLNHGDATTQVKYVGIADFTPAYAHAWASTIQGVAGSMQDPIVPWPRDADCPGR